MSANLNAMDARSLSRWSLDELQGELQERGLKTSGKKFTLAERLSAAMLEEHAREHGSHEDFAGQGGGGAARIHPRTAKFCKDSKV